MEFFGTYYFGPSESYSREIDKQVSFEEKPYGYNVSPPPADTNNYNESSRESRKEYPRKRR